VAQKENKCLELGVKLYLHKQARGPSGVSVNWSRIILNFR
jgi:hypothetical protein